MISKLSFFMGEGQSAIVKVSLCTGLMTKA